uniref:hypothetical protein n=1 Tax=Gemmiger sp. TaxID=2049027 RepID=UPI00402A3D37
NNAVSHNGITSVFCAWFCSWARAVRSPFHAFVIIITSFYPAVFGLLYPLYCENSTLLLSCPKVSKVFGHFFRAVPHLQTPARYAILFLQ